MAPIKHLDGGGQRNISGRDPDRYDPGLDVRNLFASFNDQFFWGTLKTVRVKWGCAMSTRAGVCTYEEEGGACTIELSAPLLTPRPRKDLVETLLHEMIHAYLFVTQNFQDTDDHGPEFRKHMHRINREGGMDIQVYCRFLGEMSVDESHVWRCAGRCRDERPYFGFVTTTTDRPPGPSDRWWQAHERECGGNFEKIPDEEKDANEKGKREKTEAGAKGIRTLSRSFGPENPSTSKPSDAPSDSTAADESDEDECSRSNEQSEGEAGNSNKIEGEPGSSRSSDDFEPKPGTSRSGDDFEPRPGTSRSGDDFQSEPGTSQTGGEYLLPEARPTKQKGYKGKKRRSSDVAEPNASGVEEKRATVSCPVCNHTYGQEVINEHVNACMEEQEFMNEISPDEASTFDLYRLSRGYLDDRVALERVRACLYFYIHDDELMGDDEPSADKVHCPCCWKWVKEEKINVHVDACLTYASLRENFRLHML